MTNLKHIAFIMDGNGRWAKQRAMPRTYGHLKGVESLKKIVNACLELGIQVVSLYAFSTENWNRPSTEVQYLLKLLKDNIKNKETLNWFLKNNVRFVWNGQTKNLPIDVLDAIQNLMNKTANNTKMILQIMFNYGSRLAIVDAANSLKELAEEITVESLNDKINKFGLPDLDLVVRTSGESRLSNFMLWELSYSEIIFNPTYWPDYSKEELLKDIEIFNSRQRRFGGI